ncbi:hypothetical protein BsWGS_23516 [Bradybaena similaris]
MDNYQRHGQRKQLHPTERGRNSSPCHHRYRELLLGEGHITSGRSKHSSYTVSTKDSQASNSRFTELPLSTDNSCLPLHPPQPIVHSLHGYESAQTFPHRRGNFPNYCHLQGWNFWNLCYASPPLAEAWQPGLCSEWIHRNAREELELAQNAGRQEYWQSLTDRGCYKSKTRWPARCYSQLKMQPRNTYGVCHRRLSTRRRDDEGIENQLINTVADGSPGTSEIQIEILHAFIEKLSIFPVKENSVQTIENCITSSHLPVKTSFVVDKTVHQNQKRPVFSGTLYINDVFIARVSCCGRKLLKHRVYDAALQVLKNTSAQHLLAQNNLEQKLPQKSTLAIDKKSVDQADEDMLTDNQGLIQNIRKKRVSKSRLTLTNCEQEECLDVLIQDLKQLTKDGASPVLTIDKKCIQLSMKLLTVYKIVHSPGQQTIITCDLYILDCLISQGQGSTRKKAQSDAYLKGGEVLKQSRGYEVLISFPKFNEEELSKPDIFDVVYKGYTKVYESNRCRLNRLKQLPELKRKISELVIIEHEDWAADRKKHSHCILNQSATQCGCLLEWTVEPVSDCFRCTIRLQGEEISSVLTRQRKSSLRMASCIALFRLYETQPVIQGFHLDHAQVWISREKLKQHLEHFPGDIEKLSNDHAHGNKEVDERMTRAVEEMLDQFFGCATVEEFVAAPDWKLEERKLLRTIAISKGLRVLTDVYCDDRLPIISQKYDLSEMVRILEKQTNKSQGRYRLLPTEERPSYNDIAGEVAANESMINQRQLSARVGHHCKLSSEVPVAEDAHTTNNAVVDDISLFSEDDNAFQTANSTFGYFSMKDKLTVERTSPQITSSIVLPNRTSTPVKNAAFVSSLIVGECECNWDETSRRKCNPKHVSPTVGCFNGECSQLNSESSEALSQESLSISSSTECSLTLPFRMSSLPTSVVQEQQSNVTINSYPANLVEDSSQGCAQGLWHLPQTKSQRKKFNQSVDLEAGMNESNRVHTIQWKQTDQHFPLERCIEQHQQWIEQEY